ncbi:VWD domain-containing protein [Deinococcus cellulosilyticus]|uniref:VWFD domain-containing protein n=1 Tax=Deinococcus cellulosilyticus (strain DSM 18568 / NBRC 106333 / KACC 11606 / 5516J-15) TaxID=1223518 RepID=A0A511N3B1_DEIC1|nr:VWD domain-containing protein [Deinococcus cellulosilyticus]GEM47349.1 hypothetical protein DC3_29840 [Deinococcus cellulosilyticus NBRC 106333 = KACC 11606]
MVRAAGWFAVLVGMLVACNSAPTPPTGGVFDGLECGKVRNASGDIVGTTRDNDCGGGINDPHYTTFDGLYYDFMGVGEFVFARLKDTPDLQVQTRMSPVGDLSVASLNTAVAAQVGPDRVMVALLKTGKTEVRVNGTIKTLLAPLKLAGGGEVKRFPSGDVMVTWPNTSTTSNQDRLYIEIPGNYLNVYLQVYKSHYNKLEGLLGDADGLPTNDLRVAAGSALDTTQVTFDQMYQDFAGSWRITDPAKSLFTYDSGQGPSTFNDAGKPTQFITVSDLTTEQKDRGVLECASVKGQVHENWYNACVLDVGLSGDTSFVKGLSSNLKLMDVTGKVQIKK